MSERRDLTPAEARFVSDARVGHVATARAGRWPHVVPVCHVLDGDRILIASAYDNELAQVIVFGEAYLVESGPEFERDRNLLYEKFPQYERVAPIEAGTTAIIEFRVDRVHSNGV